MSTSSTDQELAPDPARRRLLAGLAAMPALALAGWAGPGLGASFWELPRQLHLYRPALGKTLKVVYWRDGRLDPRGYRQVCELMKDHRQDAAYAMDPRLLDLLCAMQAWVAYYGFHDPIQVNSGYRTRKTNSGLEGAARNSMHLYGKAADIVFPGLPTKYVGQLAQRYAGGGVGFYYSSGFVHVDTGRLRTWSQG